MGEDETPVGLLHLGRARQEQSPPERAALDDITAFLP
jgi:hypothetical protein